MAKQEICEVKGCDAFIEKEKKRYQSKGYGLIFAFMLALTYFWAVPAFGRNFWPAILKFKQDHGITDGQFLVSFQVTLGNLIHLTFNLALLILHKNEFPLIERYKANQSEPWPWNGDP